MLTWQGRMSDPIMAVAAKMPVATPNAVLKPAASAAWLAPSWVPLCVAPTLARPSAPPACRLVFSRPLAGEHQHGHRRERAEL